MLYLVRPACLSGINRFEIGRSVTNKLPKKTEVLCAYGHLEHDTEIHLEKALIHKLDQRFVRITDRIYEGDLNAIVDVFSEIVLANGASSGASSTSLETIALHQVDKFHTMHADVMSEIRQLGYITFAACRQFKVDVNRAIARTGLRYQVEPRTTQTDITKFILFREPMLKFTSTKTKVR